MIGPIIRGMILKINLMQNYSENSVTANSSLLSPTGGVKSFSPIQENSMQYGYDENDNNNMSDETKCETNIQHQQQVEQHAQQAPHQARHHDDVDLDNCVVHTVR